MDLSGYRILPLIYPLCRVRRSMKDAIGCLQKEFTPAKGLCRCRDDIQIPLGSIRFGLGSVCHWMLSKGRGALLAGARQDCGKSTLVALHSTGLDKRQDAGSIRLNSSHAFVIPQWAAPRWATRELARMRRENRHEYFSISRSCQLI